MMKKLLVFFLITSLLTGSVISGTTTIFCVTPDGHGEIEPINSDCCSEDVHSNQPIETHDEADECSDCSDVEITNHIWKKRDKNKKTVYHTAISLVNVSNYSFDRVFSKYNQLDLFHHSKFTENIVHKVISSTIILS